MLGPFRRRRGRTAPAPTLTDTEQAGFDRAWADYVEWSGLDEAGLPEAHDGQEQ